jgi:hypothetical protein
VTARAPTFWKRLLMARRLSAVWVLVLVVSAGASAQTSGSSATSTAQSSAASQTPSSPATPPDTRPATTTFTGDTGLWYVPTGEVLAHGKWSVSGYRRGTNWIQG